MSIVSGKLFLIPSQLGKCPVEMCIPAYNIQIVNSLKYFIVEEISSAFRTLRNIGFSNSFDDVTFYELNEHTKLAELISYLECTKRGENIGLLSEAGLPCLADPGALIVAMAHSYNVKVIPLTGPSSIVSALISSGMNGQNFAFHGYLPIKSPAREQRIKQCEAVSADFNQTQIFIEAPYRNVQLFKSLIDNCLPSTLLSVASNIHCQDELIVMKSIDEWRKKTPPDIHKKPTVFCIFARFKQKKR